MTWTLQSWKTSKAKTFHPNILNFRTVKITHKNNFEQWKSQITRQHGSTHKLANTWISPNTPQVWFLFFLIWVLYQWNISVVTWNYNNPKYMHVFEGALQRTAWFGAFQKMKEVPSSRERLCLRRLALDVWSWHIPMKPATETLSPPTFWNDGWEWKLFPCKMSVVVDIDVKSDHCV